MHRKQEQKVVIEWKFAVVQIVGGLLIFLFIVPYLLTAANTPTVLSGVISIVFGGWIMSRGFRTLWYFIK